MKTKIITGILSIGLLSPVFAGRIELPRTKKQSKAVTPLGVKSLADLAEDLRTALYGAPREGYLSSGDILANVSKSLQSSCPGRTSTGHVSLHCGTIRNEFNRALEVVRSEYASLAAQKGVSQDYLNNLDRQLSYQADYYLTAN